MKKRIVVFIILLYFIILFPIRVFADSGHSTIIMDVDSGRILYEKNAYQKRLIASITKIMTCIISIENGDLSKVVKVDESINEMYGTSIYLQVDEEISIEDLLYGLMLRSGNDAAVVLSKNIMNNEAEFIYSMNSKAKEIGMKNTYFENVHGLDDGDTKNYSTAYDMAILAQYAFNNPIYRKIIGTKKYVTKSNFKSYAWYNRVSLINSYKNCVGGKNGYTPSAGKTLVSYAKKDGLTLLIVSLDDSDNYDNHKELYEKYFSNYKKYNIIDKNNFYIDSSLVDRKLYIKDSFSYPLRESEINNVSTIVKIAKNATKDNIIGKVIIKLDNKDIGSIDIFENIEKKEEPMGFFEKLKSFFSRKSKKVN